MTDVVFYFEVHQPFRLTPAYGGPLAPSRKGEGEPEWFDTYLNRFVLQRIADRCYLPMNALLRELIEQYDGRFRCSFAITGTALEQMRLWSPACIDSFGDLVDTGCVEMVCETSQHSLSGLVDQGHEFEAQVEQQRQTLRELFGVTPTTFRNTELIISESIAARVQALGFTAMLGEGADRLLGDDPEPYWPYTAKGSPDLKLLLRCYPRSDDIGFRFSNRDWEEYPLFADRFAGWVHETPEDAAFVGLFMDYETFGEHQWAGTGILQFMRAFPLHLFEDERFGFATPAEIAAANEPIGELAIPDPVSWADEERDVSAWLANPMQRSAHRRLYQIETEVLRTAELGHLDLLAAWRKLTTSDHPYYMATKRHSDGDVHEYFSPYESPHEAYLIFMHVLDDLYARVEAALAPKPAGKSGPATSKAPGRTQS